MKRIRIWLWSIVSELEYQLYPWKSDIPDEEEYTPPPDYERNFRDDWMKSQDERISRLQEEMIWVQNEIHKLHVEYRTHD